MNINMRTVVLIGIALVVAGVTAMLARSLVNSPKPTASGTQQVVVAAPVSKMKILVAASDMAVGHFIKAEDMVWQSWPDDKVNENYIQQDSETKAESFSGAVVNFPMGAGEPILNSRLVKPGNRGFMAAVLPAGKRAISIRINATSGNAGFIFPGDRVDILLTHQVKVNNGTRAKARISETVLKDVRVLAINQRTDNPSHKPSIGQTATLEVSPKEAEKISLIKNMGELALILRSLGTIEEPTQHASADPRTITWDSEVSSQISAGSSGASKNGNFTVKVFRGGGKKSQKLSFGDLMEQAMTLGQNGPVEEETEE